MTLFILTLFRSGHKLRVSSIYHLLTGKRTSSVLIFGYFHQILVFLGSLPSLEKVVFDQVIKKLLQLNYIEMNDEFGKITDLGQQALTEVVQLKQLTQLDGFRFGRMRIEMWRLILFAVQVISFISVRQKKYTPIEQRPEAVYQLKKWLKNADSNLIGLLLAELEKIFSQMPQNQADFLANQLSGYHQDGKVAFQLLAEEWQSEPWNVLFQQQCIDSFLEKVIPNSQIDLLISDFSQQNCNQSMLQTRDLFLADLNETEILQQRSIKTGTYYDHIIEWAISDENFPFEKFTLLDFKESKNFEEVIDLSYKNYQENYLNFRLSQIKNLRDCQWN